ncbi:hypothetical protein [Streptomyces sp. NBC_00291]|uniref:hypothetical protein n=1 Tax=Streptomyces sp. NBC_00291 TaxID=2975704 RepID=UPI00338DC8CA
MGFGQRQVSRGKPSRPLPAGEVRPDEAHEEAAVRTWGTGGRTQGPGSRGPAVCSKPAQR